MTQSERRISAKPPCPRKRAILKEIVKSIHIHPENSIRIDLWSSSEFAAKEVSRKDFKEKGVVLPFRKLGRPLAASFRKYASKGDGMEAIRQKVGMGVFVLGGHCGAVDTVGVTRLCRPVNGGHY